MKYILAFILAFASVCAYSQNTGPVTEQFVNGIPYASAWPTGIDACAKLRNAAVWAIAHNAPTVDARGFVGTVACASDPLGGLNATVGDSINLTVLFGATHFQSSVVWTITNSGVTLDGAGPINTVVEYTGVSGAAAVLHVSTDSGSGTPAEQGGPNAVVIRDMGFYGGAANVTDGLILNASRSRFDNIFAWGVSGCGIHLEGAEENTITHPVVSSQLAYFAGIDNNTTHTTPANGLCLDGDSVNGPLAVTSTTISDPIMEGLTTNGIEFINGNNVTITGGTSENNGSHGIIFTTDAGGVNKTNTIIGIDLEGNGGGGTIAGADILDNSGLNTFIGVLTASTFSGATIGIDLTGDGGNDLVENITTEGTNNSGAGGSGLNGAPTPGVATAGTCTQTVGVATYVNGAVRYIMACTTAP